MLSQEAAFETLAEVDGFSEPPAPAWSERLSPGSKPIAQGSELAGLAETALASRFFCWEGLSGRRYVFSVYAPSECPAFCDAVVLVAVRDLAGRRTVVSVFDSGAFPEPILQRAKRDLSAYGAALEFHIHLLAATLAEREVVRADLTVHWA
jgi:hypothetical protein